MAMHPYELLCSHVALLGRGGCVCPHHVLAPPCRLSWLQVDLDMSYVTADVYDQDIDEGISASDPSLMSVKTSVFFNRDVSCGIDCILEF